MSELTLLTEPIPVFVTLGSNVSPEENLPRAVGLLHEQVDMQRTSRVYHSIPLGPDGEILEQVEYLNAAVLIEVPFTVTPDMLKYRVLKPIEAGMGRVRTADKYASRPIDLDIALYGSLVLDDLGIPDPEILTRAHVALPLADLAPEFIHPVTGQTLVEIAALFHNHPGIIVHTMRLAF